jgi:ATP-dependent Clp protease protease subunit
MLFFRNFIKNIKSKQEGLRSQIENRRIFYFKLHGKINSKVVDEFEKILLNCYQAKQEILPLIINSTGGSPYFLISLYENIKKSKIKIATIVESKALSAGAFLLSCGNEGHRYMAKEAVFMIHDVWTTDAKPNLREIERLNNVVYGILENNSIKKNNFFRKMTKNSDLYLNAEQCLEYKIIDFIGVPTLKLENDLLSLSLDDSANKKGRGISSSLASISFKHFCNFD